jgi:peptide/nickel transport system ATP-binding protein
LSAIPRLSGVPHARLNTIGGSPPDMTRPPKGCAFAPRCQYARDECSASEPPFVYAEPDAVDPTRHGYRCFFPLEHDGADGVQSAADGAATASR